MKEFKVISIRQPWAWLIVNGYKDVENRSWATPYRGWLLIHASARRPTSSDWNDALKRLALMNKGGVLPPLSKIETGGVVGLAYLDAITTNDRSSSWAEPGMKHWRLTQPSRMRFMPAKGKLGLFDLPSIAL